MIRPKRRKAKRGFAAMSLEKRREIASKGGQAVKPENRAFAKDKDLAAEAGRKGGAQSPGKRRRRIPATRAAASPKLETMAAMEAHQPASLHASVGE